MAPDDSMFRMAASVNEDRTDDLHPMHGEHMVRMQAELDCLHAENAELRGWLEAAIKEIDNPLITMHMSAILAKTAKDNQQ